ncbi:unnamed protein product [Diabrotica balteata]|uniref:Uncharacterized protein n=1 Tax=Diabrotica balteata TaxID=107213 RepID=A0A9N9X955_DIABA|nr:unnamed protein product [Diabrotica balteata]
MKYLCFIFICVILGISHDQYGVHGEGRPVTRRFTRSAFAEMGLQFVELLKDKIISNCVANGFYIEDQLRESFTNLEVCLKNEKFYISPKEDFLRNVKKCSVEPIKLVKSCLTKEQSYFPDFLYNMAKAQIELIYNNRDVISIYVPVCRKMFEKPEIRRNYLNCLTESKKQNSSTEIPPSVEIYCERYLPRTHCLTDIFYNECSHIPKLKQYADERVKAINSPCSQKYE